MLAATAAAGSTAGTAPPRVTIFGDSAATSIAYDPDAKRIAGRGIDLRLEVAACRRLGDLSCPYDGERPPNVVERATTLGKELGRVVVVLVGYNDYEDRYALNIQKALAVFREAGVERVLWATLRAERQSYLTMNQAILEAAARSPAMTVLDWNELSRGRPDWVQEDGIHLTALGAQAMARMVSDELTRLGVAPRVASTVSIAAPALPVAHVDRTFAARLACRGRDRAVPLVDPARQPAARRAPHDRRAAARRPRAGRRVPPAPARRRSHRRVGHARRDGARRNLTG